MLKNIYKYKELISLAVIQGSGAVFPFVIFPLLLSRIGADKFSKVVFSESIIFIVLAVVIFSFDVFGVRDVNAEKNINVKMGIFKKILLFRLYICLLFLVSFLVMWLIAKSEIFIHLAIWMLLPLGMLLQSNYFFLCLSINQYLASFVFISRLIGLVLIYSMVDTESNISFVIFLLASIYLVSGVLSFVFLITKYKVPTGILKPREFVLLFKEGVNILASNLSVSLFRGSNVIILGFVATPGAVSVYALSEKLVKGVQALLNPINQLGLVRFSNKINQESELNVRSIIWYCVKSQLVISIIIVIFVNIMPFIILPLYFEVYFLNEVHLLFMMMSGSIIFGILNFMYGLVGLNMLGYSRKFATAVFITGVSSVVLSIMLSSIFYEFGAAFSYVFGEILLFFITYSIVKKINVL